MYNGYGIFVLNNVFSIKFPKAKKIVSLLYAIQIGYERKLHNFHGNIRKKKMLLHYITYYCVDRNICNTKYLYIHACTEPRKLILVEFQPIL